MLFGIKRINIKPTILGYVFSTEEKAKDFIEYVLPKKAMCPGEGWVDEIEYEIFGMDLDPINLVDINKIRAGIIQNDYTWIIKD